MVHHGRAGAPQFVAVCTCTIDDLARAPVHPRHRVASLRRPDAPRPHTPRFPAPRLLMLPHEAHGYRAREPVLHMLWDMDRWLETYVKNAKGAPGSEVASLVTIAHRSICRVG